MIKTVLRSKEISKELANYNFDLNKKEAVMMQEQDKFKLILINNQPSFFYYKTKLVPTLKHLQQNPLLKKITVDMGAIKFIINGADIMRPGIVEIDSDIKKDEFVAVIDQNHKKPLAVGMSLFDAEVMQAAKSGKMIKNIHYVGDKIWKASTS